nr:hypothetical protein [Pseudoerythrocladia kornmannii]
MIKVTSEAIGKIKNLANTMEANTAQIMIRIGIKQGGCSGLSYFMKVEDSLPSNTKDQVLEYDDFLLICDSKSMLYLYGMSLDYENSLMGGGFKFSNPNASQTCGCGQSFNI